MDITRWQHRDLKYRHRYTTTELHRQLLKGLLSDMAFSFEDRVFFYKKLQCYFLKTSISYFRNSCVFSGNARSVFRIVKLSRHSFKSKASFGFLCGFRKSSF